MRPAHSSRFATAVPARSRKGDFGKGKGLGDPKGKGCAKGEGKGKGKGQGKAQERGYAKGQELGPGKGQAKGGTGKGKSKGKGKASHNNAAPEALAVSGWGPLALRSGGGSWGEVSASSRGRTLAHDRADHGTMPHLDSSVTTLAFRMVPRRYTAWALLGEILQHVSHYSVDFVYVPRSSTQSNLGYAIVNFIDAQSAAAVRRGMEGQPWRLTRGCDLVTMEPAEAQGLDENLLLAARQMNQATLPPEYPLVFRRGAQVDFMEAVGRRPCAREGGGADHGRRGSEVPRRGSADAVTVGVLHDVPPSWDERRALGTPPSPSVMPQAFAALRDAGPVAEPTAAPSTPPMPFALGVTLAVGPAVPALGGPGVEEGIARRHLPGMVEAPPPFPDMLMPSGCTQASIGAARELRAPLSDFFVEVPAGTV